MIRDDSLDWRMYLRSLIGAHTEAVFSREDPLPGQVAVQDLGILAVHVVDARPVAADHVGHRSDVQPDQVRRVEAETKGRRGHGRLCATQLSERF